VAGTPNRTRGSLRVTPSWPCAWWCLCRRGKTASAPQYAGFSIHGAGLTRVHDLSDEMLLIAEKRTGGKATICLSATYPYSFRTGKQTHSQLGSAMPEHGIKHGHLYRLDMVVVGLRLAHGPSHPCAPCQTGLDSLQGRARSSGIC
jgi:hypothetical protein